MNITVEHYTCFTLPADARGSIVFPKATQADPSLQLGGTHPQSLGYVRSPTLIQESWKHRHNRWEPRDLNDDGSIRLPFRDYVGLREDSASVARSHPGTLCLSARNVCNEAFYTARISGKTYRTARDPGSPGNWPVLCVSHDHSKQLCMKRLDQVAATDDLVGGVPLVVEGTASSRSFLLARSEVAHTYRTDPGDKIGAKGSWLPLSTAWNDLHTRRLDGDPIEDDDFARELDEIAESVGVRLPDDTSVLAHSIVAQHADGTLQFLVLSTSLAAAATYLAKRNFMNAFVLDQSGSIGVYATDEHGDERILVSNANFRPHGTCFVLVDSGFVGPRQHGRIS